MNTIATAMRAVLIDDLGPGLKSGGKITPAI